MFQAIKDYGKSLYTNKFALIGTINLSIYATTKIIEANTGSSIPEGELFFWLGYIPTLPTLFGTTTYSTYKKTKNHIKENKTIDDRFANKVSDYYCNQIGLRLAAREAGLEHKLPQRKIKYMM